jgi:DNA-binding transcriptional ArsR family regulator
MGAMSDVYKALADPTRRAILDELSERDGQTLFEICSRLAVKHGLGSSRQAISQHLDVLELALEPATANPAAGPYTAALVADGIPATSFAVDDVHAEFQRLRALGVRFTQEPLEMGGVTTAVFDDTCGNLIQIAKA